jgi:hypothetical protein
VFVRFVGENSISIDSLFVHEIGPNGEFLNVRLVAEGLNQPGDQLSDLSETPLGTEFSLGTIDANKKFGLIIVNDGFRLNDFDSLQGGRYEVLDRATGDPATIFDSHPADQPWLQPKIYHVADDGTTIRIRGWNLFTADADQETPNSNRLNPDLQGQVISGWDDANGMLLIGVEDSFGGSDVRDFADLLIGVRFSSPLEPTLVIKDGGGGLGAVITDPDSTEMTSATITLAGLAGDRLVLDPNIADGTGIAVTRVSDTELQLDGLSSIENYEAVINATTIAIDLDDIKLGDRQIAVTVEDPDGNTGDSTTTVTVDSNLIAGTDEGETLRGTDTEPGEPGDVISGRGGNDYILGYGGDDFVDGGDGDDNIVLAGPGSSTVTGGPGADQIALGPLADTVRITGLSDGADTIRNFDATEGDRLDLRELLRDSGVTDETVDQFVSSNEFTFGGGGVRVQVDLDGPGGQHRPVSVAFLEQPVGVTVDTDPSAYVITSDPASATV